MHCPYLRHIVFTKIDKLSESEAQEEEVHPEHSRTIRRSPELEEASCREEADEKNDIDQKMNRQYLMPKGKSKYPAELAFTLESKDIQEGSVNVNSIRVMDVSESYLGATLESFSQNLKQDLEEHANIQPYALVLKTLTMSSINARTIDQEPIFRGPVRVVETSASDRLSQTEGLCTIQDFFFKITVGKTVVLFIDLQKYEVSCFRQRGHVKIHINCNSPFSFKLQSDSQESLYNVLVFYIARASGDKQSCMDSLGLTIEVVPYSRLARQADTFDLLLFKNKTFMSRMQRFFTNSNYDHVGMILKSSQNQLYLFECTSTYGVTVYPMSSFLKIDCKKYYDRYDKEQIRICYRKLQLDRTHEHVTALERFVRQSIGKKYKFDPRYLLSNAEKTQQEQTFFCSDLVAKALQQSGLLAADLQSVKFLPKHFCQEHKLQLKGCEYQNSQIIDFTR